MVSRKMKNIEDIKCISNIVEFVNLLIPIYLKINKNLKIFYFFRKTTFFSQRSRSDSHICV